jgi:glycine C-acetyltransferase
MFNSARELLAGEIEEIKRNGLFKNERVIESPQSAHITVGGKRVLNMCANNYLGLADNKELEQAAVEAVTKYGLGLASVRFICGTQTIHKELEQKIAKFHGTEDTILYCSCFDANGGLFETILGENDAVISDSLNHASIIDGVRLCKAKRFRYEHNNLGELEAHLKDAKAQNCPKILITTDGVFSMDGDIAKLSEICDLAEKYGAMVHVDECHATGFFGPTGRGATEHCGTMGRVDIITSTLGKALGGSVGGFTTGPKEVITMLRQRSRPYLFSNSLPPALVGASLACIDMLSRTTELRDRLESNTVYFRKHMTEAGFNIRPGTHPITPIMLGDAKLASSFADELLKEGLYVIGFSFPVVPKDKARIRVQVSAAHSKEDLDFAISTFTKVGRKLGVCK